jgi:hypothetical protein
LARRLKIASVTRGSNLTSAALTQLAILESCVAPASRLLFQIAEPSQNYS